MRLTGWVALWALGASLAAPAFGQEVKADKGRYGGPEAAAQPAPGQSEHVTTAFDHYVVGGGWVTVFILIPLSVAAWGLIVRCLLLVRRSVVVPPGTVRELTELFEQKQYVEAVRSCSESGSVIGKIIHAGLQASTGGLQAMQRVMEDALEEQATRLHQAIEHLNLIGSLAPMLGLLGTVNGIIGMFVSISDTGGVPVMARISRDLGSALVATFWGLSIAIPSLAAFGWFRHRIDVLMRECAGAAEGVLASLAPKTDAPKPSAPLGAKAGPGRVAVAAGVGRAT